MSAPALRKLGASCASRPAAVSSYWANQHAAALQQAQTAAPSTVEKPEEVASNDRPQYTPQHISKSLRAMQRERLGEHFQPVAKAIQEEHERGRGAARKQFAAQAAGPDDLRVPSILPITKCTLIADDPKTRKRARLSWYHPEDTMVPRDWFSKGLLADLEYYNPFGLGTRS